MRCTARLFSSGTQQSTSLSKIGSISPRHIERFSSRILQTARISPFVSPFGCVFVSRYSREWINQRLQAIQVRKELTDEWDARGVQKGVEYAILTDEITKAWSGMNTRQYKNLKGLKKENLRDNMTTLELVLNMLAEATTTEISRQKAPVTFSENLSVARKGGEAAGIARKAVEERTGVPVISSKNAAQLNQVVTNLIESVESVTDGTDKSKK